MWTELVPILWLLYSTQPQCSAHATSDCNPVLSIFGISAALGTTFSILVLELDNPVTWGDGGII